ncbi:MAG: cobalt ECF transporter T component CbiQ, partial [Peptococcaceae bacterium]|nr:cobalt ECF transporter T component CbiQ [Peptococcaceae bacterium]
VHVYETLALGDTVYHKLHPLTKLCSALVFLCTVASFGRYDFLPMAPYVFYPVVIAAVAEIPWRDLFPKLVIALPFCLFAGLSNALLDPTAAFFLFGAPISYGILSLLTILLKMFLCVSAALLLAATTPLTELSGQLRRLRVPYIFVMIFEMTYRYIGLLLEEAHAMTTAYILRGAGKKAPDMQHMGSFLGQLLLRGFSRSERVYDAMRCRGWARKEIPRAGRSFTRKDAVFLGTLCAAALFFRLFAYFPTL